MENPACWGTAPILFCQKPSGNECSFQAVKDCNASKLRGKENRGLMLDSSYDWTGDFLLMMELRNKILALRDITGLALCDSSVSINELLLGTMQDLHKQFPDTIPEISVRDMKGMSINQGLAYLYSALKVTGDSWMVNKEWESYVKMGNDNIDHLEVLLPAIDCMIKARKEKLLMMEKEGQKKDYSVQENVFEKVLMDSTYPDLSSSGGSSPVTPFCHSPHTPTSVLPERSKVTYTPQLLMPLRVQAVGKLKPVDLERLSFHLLPHGTARGSVNKRANEEPNSSIASKENCGGMVEESITKETKSNKHVEQMPHVQISNLEEMKPCEIEISVAQVKELPKELQPHKLSSNGMETETSSPSQLKKLNIDRQPPPPPPLSQPSSSSQNSTPNTPPLPSPPKLKLHSNLVSPPPPPPLPQPNLGNEAATLLPPPPPPFRAANGASPPPPPPIGGAISLRPKKANTKLKRSTHMGNLYRVLKGKVEGCSPESQLSRGGKGKIGNSSSAKQGMADALAEMTKRSAYFQQIEEDARQYAESITELKAAISSFQTKDTAELLKFHRHVESLLENLTDETQVLTRFEGFPTKKLETLRTAATLYLKLEKILTTLLNWKIDAPLNQLLDKVERNFNKVKGEVDALERTKDEEAKRFQSHNIHFDFGILVKIKESMVDVSSSCMELALKERRELKATENEEAESKRKERTKGSVKMLWKAFQLAFRVYSFAGGQDERADNLSRELAQEIESDPHN